jgi:hypothetical protein
LTVEGRAVLVGDLDVPAGQALVFVGGDSFLEVRGTIHVRGTIIFYVSEEERLELKQHKEDKTVIYVEHPFMTSTHNEGTKPLTVRVSAHARRACNSPYAILKGSSTQWIAGWKYRNQCDLWWIIVLCTLPSVIGAFLSIILSK